MNFKLPIPITKLEAISDQFGVEYPKSVEPEEATRRTENLTLIDGKTFLSTNVAGDIMPAGAPDVGFFCHDTRFLSCLELKVNHRHAIVLSSSTEKTFASQIELTAARATLRESFDLPENTVHIRRQQLVSSETFFDRFTFLNFNRSLVHLSIELLFDADFADVFEVRGIKRPKHGQFYRPVQDGNCLVFLYRGLDDTLRQTVIEMNPIPTSMGDRGAQWQFDLGPGKKHQVDITVHPIIGEGTQKDRATIQFSNCLATRRQRYASWDAKVTHFSSSHGIFDAVLSTAVGDFHALQIADRDEGIVAAGIPWFATIFGRDSIIASFQSLILDPQLACDTLRVLARYQGQEHDDWRDEEPGKILHEYRQGEMTCA